jgi:hypothetical protein
MLDSSSPQAGANSHDNPAPQTAPPPSQNFPPFPIPENNSAKVPQVHAPLTPKQLLALNRLFAGDSEQAICHALQINRRTLYNWKRHNPAFAAEMNRRHAELWTDVAADLRYGVADAVTTLRDHLRRAREPITQLRAARALINLVNAPRLAPTEPTNIVDIIDQLMRAALPRPKPDGAPTFTDAQRQAFLEQLEAEQDAATGESAPPGTAAT